MEQLSARCRSLLTLMHSRRSGAFRRPLLGLRTPESLRPRRRRQRLLDGKIDLSGFIDADDFHFDSVAHFQKIVDVVDKGVGDLRDMYQAAGAAGQLNKRPEFCDPGNFSFQDLSYFQIHALPFSLQWSDIPTLLPVCPLRFPAAEQPGPACRLRGGDRFPLSAVGLFLSVP